MGNDINCYLLAHILGMAMATIEDVVQVQQNYMSVHKNIPETVKGFQKLVGILHP